MSEIQSGYFIKFTPEEFEHQEALDEYLDLHDYPPAPEGIKLLLIDVVNGQSKKKKSPIADIIQENPEAVRSLMEGIGKLGGLALNAKIFKKK